MVLALVALISLGLAWPMSAHAAETLPTWGEKCESTKESEAEVPPEPTTCLENRAPDDIGRTEVRLNGVINPHGLRTWVSFAYYPEGDGEAAIETPLQEVRGSQNIYLHVPVTGLQPGTKYDVDLSAGKPIEEGAACEPTGICEFAETVPFTTLGEPPPPTGATISYLPVTEKNSVAAVLNDTVNPNGSETWYYFEYGKTTQYGTDIPALSATDIGAGTTGIYCWNLIEHLEPGTTYHFRVVVLGGGRTYGEDQTFTTPGATISYLPVTEKNSVAAVINDTVYPNGYDTHEYFEYGKTTKYGTTIPAPPGNDIGSGTGGIYAWNLIEHLEPGTTYHFRIVVSSGGGTAYGEDQTFTTPGATIAYLAVTKKNSVAAVINDTVYPNGYDTHEYFEYGKTTKYGTTIPAPPGNDIGSGTGGIYAWNLIEHLEPGTTYHFRVVVSSDGGTAYGEDQAFTTLGATIAYLPVTEKNSVAAVINDTVYPNGYDTHEYFEYGKTTKYGTTIPAPPGNDIGSGTGGIYAWNLIEHLEPGTTYHFRIVVSSDGGTAYGEDQTFTTTGTAPVKYVSSFGSEGTGTGQFKHPGDVKLDSKGNLWVVDYLNARVEEFNEKGEFRKSFGVKGSGNGQLSYPRAVALDAKGNIWVLDTGNFRVEEFNEKGEFQKVFGAKGTGNGQFTSSPEGIAIDAHGNVWVSDTYGGRLEVFNEKGEFQKSVASKGSGAGQVGEPEGLAAGSGGKIWVADWSNNRVEVFTEQGTFSTQFGSLGSGSGQLKNPYGLTVDASGNAWVADVGNSRVEAFNATGEYLAQFGSAGKGEGQFTFYYPVGLTISATRTLWVTDALDNRIERWE